MKYILCGENEIKPEILRSGRGSLDTSYKCISIRRMKLNNWNVTWNGNTLLSNPDIELTEEKDCDNAYDLIFIPEVSQVELNMNYTLYWCKALLG